MRTRKINDQSIRCICFLSRGAIAPLFFQYQPDTLIPFIFGVNSKKMIITYKLDKSFGSQMAFSGYVLMVIGLIFIVDLMGIVLFITGFFLATTVEGVSIDVNKRLIKKFSGPLGLRMIGKWEELDRYEGFTLVPFRTKQVTMSRSNRQHLTQHHDFRIFTVGQNHKPAFAVYKSNSKDRALHEMEILSELLHWKVWTTDKSDY